MKKQEALKRYLHQVAPVEPTESLESLGEVPALRKHIERAPASDDEKAQAETALDKIRAGEDLTGPEEFALEAIIIPGERPVVDIKNNTFDTVEEPFAQFGQPEIKTVIESVIPSIGRVELPELPTIPYGGTCFVVGENLLMTNRHVAALFAEGLGRDGVSFKTGQAAGVDFKRERGDTDGTMIDVREIRMIHPYWDMALLEVSGLADNHPVLRLAVEDPEAFVDDDIAVIGYPAFDPRNNAELQQRIFDGVFNVKRLQPGRVRERGPVRSFGSTVDAMRHDASTLGGNSGSAVLHIGSGQIIALHFAGLYLDANFAVPTSELARDRRVVAADVQFEPAASPGPVPWEKNWRAADPNEAVGGSTTTLARGGGTATAVPALAGGPASAASWVVPVEISVRVGTASRAADGTAAGDSRLPDAAEADLIEAAVEPFHEDTYDNRQGYDENFLGIPLPPPEVTDLSEISKLDDGEHRIPYEHFSVVMHKRRRLAVFTAANVDADPQSKEPEPGKDYTRKGLAEMDDNDREKWFTDPRIPEIHQLPDKFFNDDRQAFDKGHIVRRVDVAWGTTYNQVQRANGDTFHVTNCSPQVLGFNRSNRAGLWGKLENLILKQAATEKLIVFGGPVLDDDNDRLFRGVDDQGATEVQIPSRYWKVVVARSDQALESFGFLLEQNLDDVDFGVEFALPAEWQHRMIAIDELEGLLGNLAFHEAVLESDQFESDVGESVRRLGHLQ